MAKNTKFERGWWDGWSIDPGAGFNPANHLKINLFILSGPIERLSVACYCD